jgi:hypothetical protein
MPGIGGITSEGGSQTTPTRKWLTRSGSLAGHRAPSMLSDRPFTLDDLNTALASSRFVGAETLERNHPIHFTNVVYDGMLYTLTYKCRLPALPCHENGTSIPRSGTSYLPVHVKFRGKRGGGGSGTAAR